MILKLESVSKSYRERKIVERFSMEVESKERVVLWGPSGCGKTTILRMIAGFIQPDEGSIVIDGVTVSRNGKSLVECEKREIGVVFQELALWPHMTVYENIAFGLEAISLSNREIQERVDVMLEMVRLTRHRKLLPGELSGGEQQRVAIARALVTRPKLLLMDEPFSHLDALLSQSLQEEVLNLLQKFPSTLLYVTHSRQEAESLATRMIAISDSPLL